MPQSFSSGAPAGGFPPKASSQLRIYSTGQEVSETEVFLRTCKTSDFDSINWTTKRIFGQYEEGTGPSATAYIHVCVSKEEWSDPDKFAAPKQKREKRQTVAAPVAAASWKKAGMAKSNPASATVSHPKVQSKKTEEKKEVEQKKEKEKAAVDPEEDVPSAPIEDPDIGKYIYDVTIRIIGEVGINTTDFKHRARLKTGIYSARKMINSDGPWLMLRYPQDTGKTEYGLLIRQWLQYQRDDSEATVKIEGLH